MSQSGGGSGVGEAVSVGVVGVEGKTAVYVGDSPLHDVIGGQRAGMKTVHFESSQRFENPTHVKPDAIIQSLPDLLTTLDEWKIKNRA